MYRYHKNPTFPSYMNNITTDLTIGRLYNKLMGERCSSNRPTTSLPIYKKTIIEEFNLTETDPMYDKIMTSTNIKALHMYDKELNMLRKEHLASLSYKERIDLKLSDEESRVKRKVLRKEAVAIKSKCAPPPPSRRDILISLLEEREDLMFNKTTSIVEVFLKEERDIELARKITRELRLSKHRK